MPVVVTVAAGPPAVVVPAGLAPLAAVGATAVGAGLAALAAVVVVVIVRGGPGVVGRGRRRRPVGGVSVVGPGVGVELAGRLQKGESERGRDRQTERA